MRHAALFSLLTILSSLSLLRALQLVTNPTPIVTKEAFTLTFNREDGDPNSYTLQLLLANTTTKSQNQLVTELDFKGGESSSITKNFAADSPNIFGIPQAHTFVATPADLSKTVALTFSVVDQNGASIPTPQLDGSSTSAPSNSGSGSGSSNADAAGSSGSSTTTDSNSQSSSGADSSDSSSSGDSISAVPTADNVTPPSATDGASPTPNSTDGSIPSVSILNNGTSPTLQPTSGSDEQDNPTTAAAVSSRKSNTGIIAGAVIGSLVLVAILIAAALYVRKRSRDRSRPLSFNRDMMVRQPGPGSLLSSTGSSFEPNRYTNNPHSSNPFEGRDEKGRLSGDYEAQAM